MRSAAREVTRIDSKDEGEWLQLLLADIQREIAEQPRPGAVARIRGRVFAALSRPEKQAA